MRVQRDTKEIIWNYIYSYRLETDTYKALFTAGYIHQDPTDRTRMYLLGRFNNRASVIKFAKRSMNIDWKLQIGSSELAQADPYADQAANYPSSDMNEIYSFVQPERSNKIYACGYRWKDAKTAPDKRTASMFKMDDEG